MCKPATHQRKASGSYVEAVCKAVTPLQRKSSAPSSRARRKSSSPGVLLRKLFGQEPTAPCVPPQAALREQWLDWEYTNLASHAAQAAPAPTTESSDEGSTFEQAPANSARVEVDAGGRMYTCVTSNEIFKDTISPPAALELRRCSWLDWDNDVCQEACKTDQAAPFDRPEWLSSVAKAVEVGFQVDANAGTTTVCFDGNCIVVPTSELQVFDALTGCHWRRSAPLKVGL